MTLTELGSTAKVLAARMKRYNKKSVRSFTRGFIYTAGFGKAHKASLLIELLDKDGVPLQQDARCCVSMNCVMQRHQSSREPHN